MVMKLTEYMREKDVLKVWPFSKSTLIRARHNGLEFVRLGAFVCYKPEDLEAYFCQPRSRIAAALKGTGGNKNG